MLLLKAIWGHLIANKPQLQSIEDLTTVYVLKWVVFVLAEKGVGSHYDVMCNLRATCCVKINCYRTGYGCVINHVTEAS